ncbi:hypothetical protein BDN70DRAFT_862745 [Pholiota conissans]|uniref:GATA-type domain-containing protein n=1 Tax=Pholiota conissans TaxID=109636 RepID=A0A9P5YX46_9AGAR|nr:hypothetical protein BDN70DRAFT_862745 [Pholiota conissans]
MPLHSRQHSIDFSPPDKHQTTTSSASTSPMLCTYASSALYPPASGNAGPGNWTMNQRQQYHGLDTLASQDHERARWLAQQQSQIRPRERRLECPNDSTSIHSHHVHQEVSSPSFSNSPHLLRPSGYDSHYSRNMPTTMPSSVPSWNSWEMDASSAASTNSQYQRFADEPSSWNSHLNLDIPEFESQNFDSMIMSGSDSSSSSTLYTPANDAIPLNGFSFPHRISPEAPSPSPSPVYHHHPRRASGSSLLSTTTSKTGEDRPETGKSCSHCRATSTPLWRRDPNTMKPLCNACGLYLQQRNKLRPQELIDADDDGSSSEESDPNYVGPECSHCRTHHTSVWRRSKTGDQLCNACGVYQRLRGKPRPLTLRKNKIRPRSKHSPK